jgi:exonuclease SbcD
MNQTGVHFSQVFNSKPQKITLRDEYGDVNIYMLPFVRPVDVRAVYENELEESDQTIETYDTAVQKAIDAMAPDYSQRNILVAHQYFKGGERCEGEDSVGGLDDVDAEIVKDFDYVALGHLHRPQHVQQYPHIRYSGSPLKYSFSEVNHQKSVSIIECNEKGNLSIKKRELIPLHDWIDIRGTYDELMSEQFYRGKGYENKYVRITLTDEDDIVDGMKKLKGVYPLAMSLEYDNTRTRTESKVGIGDIQKKPIELIEEFFEKQNGQAMNGDQHELVTNLINKLEL